jgi:hypothetical protein
MFNKFNQLNASLGTGNTKMTDTDLTSNPNQGLFCGEKIEDCNL